MLSSNSLQIAGNKGGKFFISVSQLQFKKVFLIFCLPPIQGYLKVQVAEPNAETLSDREDEYYDYVERCSFLLNC